MAHLSPSHSPLIAITSQYSARGEEHSPHYGVRKAYIEALLACGATPIILPVGVSQIQINAVLQVVDGVLIPGGADVDPLHYNATPHPQLGGLLPQRDELEIAVIKTAYAAKKPIFGICRGMQLMNVALGGTLWQDLPSERPSELCHSSIADKEDPDSDWFMMPHTVIVQPSTQLTKIVESLSPLNGNAFAVNSLHHQAVRNLAPGLIASAVADDGIIEALEAPQSNHPFFVGVQWHPEVLLSSNSDAVHKAIFTAFLNAAAEQKR